MNTKSKQVVDLTYIGCLSVRLCEHAGAPVIAFGNVPPALKGAKWADVTEWRVFFCCGGMVFVCRHSLKSEDGKPWELESVARHFDEYPKDWRRIL